MPRVNLTDEEAELIAKLRHKTEVDRTHNVALETAAAAARAVVEDYAFNTSADAVHQAELARQLDAAILSFWREVKLG